MPWLARMNSAVLVRISSSMTQPLILLCLAPPLPEYCYANHAQTSVLCRCLCHTSFPPDHQASLCSCRAPAPLSCAFMLYESKIKPDCFPIPSAPEMLCDGQPLHYTPYDVTSSTTCRHVHTGNKSSSGSPLLLLLVAHVPEHKAGARAGGAAARRAAAGPRQRAAGRARAHAALPLLCSHAQ